MQGKPFSIDACIYETSGGLLGPYPQLGRIPHNKSSLNEPHNHTTPKTKKRLERNLPDNSPFPPQLPHNPHKPPHERPYILIPLLPAPHNLINRLINHIQQIPLHIPLNAPQMRQRRQFRKRLSAQRLTGNVARVLARGVDLVQVGCCVVDPQPGGVED